MGGICKDARRETGPIPANPSGTAHGSRPDVVAKSLKWRTLLRFLLLAGHDPWAASTTTLYEYGPLGVNPFVLLAAKGYPGAIKAGAEGTDHAKQRDEPSCCKKGQPNERV